MNNKYLTLWLCVSLGAIVIIVGWVYSIKFNMAQIDNEMNQNANDADSKIEEFETMVDEMKTQMDKNWENLKLETANTTEDQTPNQTN